MSSDHTAANGASYTEADLEQWAEEAENGYPGWKFGKPQRGRPVSVGAKASPSFTMRLDPERRERLEAVAAARHTTASQLLRDFIDTLPAG